jgi:hypothetical protein
MGLFKREKEIVYHPEVNDIGPVGDKEYEGLMLAMERGYQDHAMIFKFLLLLRDRREAEMSRPVSFENQADEFKWRERQKVLATEVNMLRYLCRLPLEANRLKKAKESKSKLEDIFTDL